MRQRKLVRGRKGKSFSAWRRRGKRFSTHDGRGGQRRTVKTERQVPSEGRIWLDVGMLALGGSITTALRALTLSEGARIDVWVLWTIFIAAAVLSVACFVAHWDTNRGRKVKRSEVTEEKDEDES